MNGPQLVNQLQQLEKSLQESADRIQSEIIAGENELNDTIVRRGETFVELARHYLPTLDQESVDRAYVELKDELTNVLNRKTRELRQLQEKIAELEEPHRRREAELQELTAELNEMVRRRDTMEEQLAERLASDREFNHLSQEVLDSQQRLQQDEKRVAEIQREADEKLPAYQRSELFGYLYNRDFGTPSYKASSLTRRLDTWVASLIDFRRARKSYEFLLVTPRLMVEEVERRRSDCEEFSVRLDAIRADASKSIGLDSVLEDGDRLGEQHEALVAELEESDIELEGLRDQLATVNESRGRFYDEAIARLKKLLEDTSTAVLRRQASQTPEPQDDEIVAEIQWLDEQADTLNDKLRESRDKQRTAERQQRGIGYVLRRCRQSDVDSDRCFFDESLDLENTTEQFTRGSINEHELLKYLREHQQFHPTWTEKTLEKTTDTLQKPGVQMALHVIAAVGGELLRYLASNQGSGQRSRKRFTKGPGY